MLSLMLKVGATAGVVKLMVDNSAVILGDETATSECGGRSCIRLGAEGKLIQEINIRLAGFGGNVPTTNFTARTANMIRQFQRDYMEIQPTGRICGDTLKAIDEFGDNYTFVWDELKCPCGVCDGFGQGLYSEQKQDAGIAERSRRYEYPGIHRSLLWAYKAAMFYLTKKEGGIYTVNSSSSGYRCNERNKQRGRSSTNHMGKAIDVIFNKNGTRTRSNADIEKIRSEVFNKCLGAKWDWRAEKDIFYLESTSMGATTWVHFDVREFNITHLKDEFFANTEAAMYGQKICDLANAEGYAETCACLGDYASQDGATTDAHTYKWSHSEFGNLIAQNESQNDYNRCNKTLGGLRQVRDVVVVEKTIQEIQEMQDRRDVFAVGRYQIIPDTLDEAVRRLGLDVSQLMNEEMQDRIFDEFLIDLKRPPIIAFLEGSGSVEDAMHAAAKEWASIGVEAGRSISRGRTATGGESYYAGDGLNRAHITPDEIRQALINSKNANQ